MYKQSCLLLFFLLFFFHHRVSFIKYTLYNGRVFKNEDDNGHAQGTLL